MENKKNGFRGSGKMSPSEGFYEKMYFREKFYDRILKRSEWFKCATVLGLKNFSWFKELELDFGVHPSIANQFILECKEQGLIVSKLLSQLDNLYYEAIIRTKSVKFYEQVNNINILTLTPEGINFFKSFLEDNKEHIENNNHLKFNFDEVKDKIKYLLITLKQIKEEESTLLSRKVKYPGIGYIHRDSEVMRKRRLDIKKASLEFKEELLERKKFNELTNKERGQLDLIKNKGALALVEDKEKHKLKYGVKYDGIYSNLSLQEIEKISQGVTKEEEKQEEKNFNKEIKDKIKNMNNQRAFIGKGYHNENKSKNKDEGLDFLDNLEK